MVEIAILGYGTVGSGVFETLQINAPSIQKKAGRPIVVKRVLTRREYPGDPVEKYLTHDFEDILNDDGIRIVVEAMGGLEPAYTYLKKALLRGKNVVTSNKELVATHGAELLEIARKNNINFLFEASVGGGIPIIRPLNQSLTADEIYEITGVLNGTSNFILSKMECQRAAFSDVLKEAQDRGYAERDPSADVDGYDAARKMAILLSLATGEQVDYENIYTEGIGKITEQDFTCAHAIWGRIKPIATAKITEKGIYAAVAPFIVVHEHPLTGVINDVFSAILVKGNIIDQVMFCGRGAGKFPTAASVVADVVDAARNLDRNVMQMWSSKKRLILPAEDFEAAKLIRLSCTEPHRTEEMIKKIFGEVRFIERVAGENGFAFVCPKESMGATASKIKQLENEGATIESVIQILAV